MTGRTEFEHLFVSVNWWPLLGPGMVTVESEVSVATDAAVDETLVALIDEEGAAEVRTVTKVELIAAEVDLLLMATEVDDGAAAAVEDFALQL